MTVRFGVHAGLQNTSLSELRGLCERIKELGFDWISICKPTSDVSGGQRWQVITDLRYLKPSRAIRVFS